MKNVSMDSQFAQSDMTSNKVANSVLLNTFIRDIEIRYAEKRFDYSIK